MRFSLFIKQHVSRFDVPMQNAVFVGIVHGARQFCDQLHCATDRYRLLLNYFVELATFDQVHAEVATTIALTDFVNRNNEWVVQARSCLSFETEAFQMCFGGPSTDANNL